MNIKIIKLIISKEKKKYKKASLEKDVLIVKMEKCILIMIHLINSFFYVQLVN